MRKWARVGIVVMVVFIAATAAWATSTWVDTQPLALSKKPPSYATFTCGAIFGSATAHRHVVAHPPTEALTRQPCRDRGQRQVLASIDLGLGAVGLVGFTRLFRRARADQESLPD